MSSGGNRSARLGLGTAQFGLDYGISNRTGKVGVDEVRRILARAGQKGVRIIDTAADYGDAEIVLREAIGPGQTFRIVTKTTRLSAGLGAVLARTESSVRRLTPPGVDTLLVHSAGDLTQPEGAELWSALTQMKRRGTISRLGISAYFEDDPVALAQRYSPDVLQLPLSVLDQRLVAGESLRRLKDLGVEIHARSVFLQGLLFLSPDALPPKIAAIGPRLADIRRHMKGGRSTPLRAAMDFILSRDEIDAAIVGVTCLRELDEILSIAQSPSIDLDWPALALEPGDWLSPPQWR